MYARALQNFSQTTQEFKTYVLVMIISSEEEKCQILRGLRIHINTSWLELPKPNWRKADINYNICVLFKLYIK